MIDTHSHILPGLDDGSQNLEQAIAMARIAVGDGIREVICTPHWTRGTFENSRQSILDTLRDFRENLHRLGIPLSVHPGAELRIDFQIADKIREGEILTLNDSGRFALIELPAEFVPPGTEHFFYMLQVAGISPIAAHPERNPSLIKDPMRIYRWIESGVLTQVTSRSLLGKFGEAVRKLCVLMIEHRMVHLMATDAHHPANRAPRLSEGRKELELIGGKTMADRIVTGNPQAILQADNPITLDPIPLKKRFTLPFQRLFSFSQR